MGRGANCLHCLVSFFLWSLGKPVAKNNPKLRVIFPVTLTGFDEPVLVTLDQKIATTRCCCHCCCRCSCCCCSGRQLSLRMLPSRLRKICPTALVATQAHTRARAFAKKERAIFFAKRTEELVADMQLSVRISQVKAELTFCSSHPQTKKREKNVNIFGGVCFRFDSKKSWSCDFCVFFSGHVSCRQTQRRLRRRSDQPDVSLLRVQRFESSCFESKTISMIRKLWVVLVLLIFSWFFG